MRKWKRGMSKAIFVKLNFFSKNTVNYLENLTGTVYSQLLKKKKKGIILLSAITFCHFLYYLYYFNGGLKLIKWFIIYPRLI